MAKQSNAQAMCDILLQNANHDKDLLVVTSDSRGSGKVAPFGEKYPNQLVEIGIAEQNLVSISAGLAHAGKKPIAISPASFLSMRSIEQVKVDVAYSNTNVKLVGISGGVSYGALGMSHHSLQDFAVTRAIPNLQVLVPADANETKAMFKALLKSKKPGYIRLGRSAVPEVYPTENYDFEIGKAVTLKEGNDISLIATGETVHFALEAALLLDKLGVSAEVLNVHTLKPFDNKTVLTSSLKTGKVITIEEHSIHGGLGAAVSESLSEKTNVIHRILGFPDEELVTGTPSELYSYYGLDAEGIVKNAQELLET